MNYKFFTIPVFGSEAAEMELNRFLNHKEDETRVAS